jgi:hypothetical protein
MPTQKLSYGTAEQAGKIIGVGRVQFFNLLRQDVFGQVGIEIRRHRQKFCLTDVRAYRDKVNIKPKKKK